MIVVVGQGEERNDMTEEELEVCVTFIVRAHLVSTKLVSSPTVFYNMSIKTTLSSIPSANAEGEIWHMTKTCVMYFSAIINWSYKLFFNLFVLSGIWGVSSTEAYERVEASLRSRSRRRVREESCVQPQTLEVCCTWNLEMCSVHCIYTIVCNHLEGNEYT